MAIVKLCKQFDYQAIQHASRAHPHCGRTDSFSGIATLTISDLLCKI